VAHALRPPTRRESQPASGIAACARRKRQPCL
jgi:hypothetical protein